MGGSILNKILNMKHFFTLGLSLSLTMGTAFGQCPPGETEVTMTIVTDRYGEETTWEVTGPGGTPVYGSGGPYTQQPANGEYPQPPVSFCVPDGSVLEITVDDTYGDGMCCAYGNGSWTISVGGVDVASGGTFASSETSSVVIGKDLGVAALSMEAVIAQGSTTIEGTVANNGTEPVSGFMLAYAVDGGTPVQQTFTATVAPGAAYDFSFGTPWSATVGPHSIDLTLSGVPGDLFPGNDMLMQNVNVATQSVSRVVVMEEFTSSTCPPCASFNAVLDPYLSSLNTNEPGSGIVAVKYQMDWPAPGNDPSYNQDGETRRAYYGVTGIPDPFVDGVDVTTGGTDDAIMEHMTKAAFVDLITSNTISGTTLTVDVELTPYADFPGSHKLFIAATENYYPYPASTTSQDEFHYAMRKVLPNGNGITLSALQAGVTQTETQSHTFTIGNPAQGNSNLWGSSMNNITVVTFIQNTSTGEILQGGISLVTTSIGENELDRGLSVFPNPSNGLVFLDVELEQSAQVSYQVFNALGEIVRTESRSTPAGGQRFTMDMSDLESGLYYVSVQSGDMRATRKVTLTR